MKTMKPKNAIIRKISDVLIKAMPITLALTMICSIIVIINVDFLNKKGIFFTSNFHGNSMYPLIKEGALLLIADDTAAPFEDLKEGDIVVYHERTNSVPTILNLTPIIIDTDASSNDPSDESTDDLSDGSTNDSSDASSDVPSDSPVFFSTEKVTITPGRDSQDGSYKDEGAEYNSDKYILHQIIKVNEADENSDRVIFTRGINNPVDDPKATLKSGYFGKLLWHMNGIGPIYNFFITGPGFLIVALLLFVSIGNYLVRLFQSCKDPDKADEYAHSKVPSDPDNPI